VEPVVVKIPRNVDPADEELIDAFIGFLWSEPAQRAMADHGFRRADAALRAGEGELADVQRLLTVESLGGVRAVADRIARGAARSGA
jgi:ABC-type sulfate transport system substrate-binding protein